MQTKKMKKLQVMAKQLQEQLNKLKTKAGWLIV